MPRAPRVAVSIGFCVDYTVEVVHFSMLAPPGNPMSQKFVHSIRGCGYDVLHGCNTAILGACCLCLVRARHPCSPHCTTPRMPPHDKGCTCSYPHMTRDAHVHTPTCQGMHMFRAHCEVQGQSLCDVCACAGGGVCRLPSTCVAACRLFSGAIRRSFWVWDHHARHGFLRRGVLALVPSVYPCSRRRPLLRSESEKETTLQIY